MKINKFVTTRNNASDLQNAVIVVLHNVDEKNPSLKLVGWTEDGPHDSDDEAILLYEPLYFVEEPPTEPKGSGKLLFFIPTLGLPNSIEVFTYGKVECYEGVSHFGAMYIDSVIGARDFKTPLSRSVAYNRPVKAQPPVQQPPQNHHMITNQRPI